MSIIWNTAPAAMRARHNLKLKKNKKIKKIKGFKLLGGPARKAASSKRARTQIRKGFKRVGPPEKFFIYTNRHPQPPAKCIGLNGICQEHYCRTLKINMLTAPGLWDIVG